MKMTSTNNGILFEIFVKPMSKNCRILITNDEVILFRKKLAHKGKANKDLTKVLSHLFEIKLKLCLVLSQ